MYVRMYVCMYSYYALVNCCFNSITLSELSMQG